MILALISGCIVLLYLSKAGKRGGPVIDKWLISELHFCLLVLVLLGWQKCWFFLDFEPLPWKAAFDFLIWHLQALISFNTSTLWWKFLTALSRNFWSQLQERRLARQISSLENLFHRNKFTKNPPFCVLPRISDFSKCQKISLSQIKKWVGPMYNAIKWPLLKILKQNWRLFWLNVKNIFSPI